MSQGTKLALERPLEQAVSPSGIAPADRAATGPARSFSLAEIEDFLSAMVASAEMVTDEQMTEYLADLGEAGEMARDKRDRCVHALMKYDDMVQMINARAAHHQAHMDQLALLRTRVEAEKGRFERYLLSIVETYGQVPKRAKAKRLEGNVFALAAERGASHLEVFSETDVPKKFKRVAVTLSLPIYERLCELGFTHGYDEQDLPYGTVTVRKTEAKNAIDAGEDVPGARIEDGATRLVIRGRKL